jgi:hypothetical protein
LILEVCRGCEKAFSGKCEDDCIQLEIFSLTRIGLVTRIFSLTRKMNTLKTDKQTLNLQTQTQNTYNRKAYIAQLMYSLAITVRKGTLGKHLKHSNKTNRRTIKRNQRARDHCHLCV